MGGGAVWRAAANVASIGNGGLRNLYLTPTVEHNVKNVQRKVSITLSSQGGKAVETAPADKSTATASLDDRELAGYDELTVGSPKKMARAVFDGVPSFQEAREATEELKVALDKLYLSPSSSTAPIGSSAANNLGRLPLTLPSTESEAESSTTENVVAHSVPTKTLQALKLLSTSPEVRNVVASIACDPNVWNAVVENRALKEFFQSQQPNNGSQSQGKERDAEDNDGSEEENDDIDLKEIMQKMKLKVVDLINNVSKYMQNIFRFPAAASENGNENSKAYSVDRDFMEVCFMGLAVLAAMVVMLKRT